MEIFSQQRHGATEKQHRKHRLGERGSLSSSVASVVYAFLNWICPAKHDHYSGD